VLGQQLRGEVPSDVQGAIGRRAAERSLFGGFGAGSQAGRNLELRDLGLTSLDIQNRGLANTGQFIQQQRNVATTPLFDITSTFLSPVQRVQIRAQERQSKIGAITGLSGLGAQLSTSQGILGNVLGGLGGAAVSLGTIGLLSNKFKDTKLNVNIGSPGDELNDLR